MYFNSFPLTKFNNINIIDITRKLELDKAFEKDALAYMNYTVEEGEKPEDVAYYYYDDPSYAWLVLLSNNIVDPYTHWPKDFKSFEEYLKVQYASEADAQGQAVIEWTKNATIGSNIVHYESLKDPNIRLNRASYLNATDNERAEFFPVRVYDYEFALNEERRQIVLVNKALLPSLKAQMEPLLNAD